MNLTEEQKEIAKRSLVYFSAFLSSFQLGVQFQSKDSGSNECITFGTANVSSVKIYIRKENYLSSGLPFSMFSLCLHDVIS